MYLYISIIIGSIFVKISLREKKVNSHPAGLYLVSCCMLVVAVLMPATVTANINLRMQTDLGGVDIELFDVDTPQTVANFMTYVDRGDYDGTFIHRSVPGFVLQMGGYIFDSDDGDFFGSGTVHIDTDPPVVNEPGISNLRGTIAMAKTGGDPDSATSEFFFNLADNSANLDNQNGGFTVFGEATGNGMDTIDEIAGKIRCGDYFVFNLGQCNGLISFSESPLLHMVVDNPQLPTSFLNSVTAINTVEILNIGTDSDGDGIIDRVEDSGPNAGDANNDGLSDSGQGNVASFESDAGDYLYLESRPGITIESMEVMGQTYGLTTFSTAEPPPEFQGTNIAHGYIGFELRGIIAGAAETVNMTLPEGQNVKAYLMYGPTPDNPLPHWYEFDFDGDTGAEIDGNVVTLHFIDGLRGDADLAVNGVIVDPGTPALKVKNSAAGGGGSGGGSGGCSAGHAIHTGPQQASEWWLLLLLLSIQGLRLGMRRYPSR